jgi:hypothetical protein
MTNATASIRALTAVAVCTLTLGAFAVARADQREWKGAETFAPVAIGPNLARCGSFPRNLEARFVGSGIDTFGGPFTVAASGCLDTEANVLSDVEATDTYLGTGDSVHIAPADAALDFDPTTCTATNRRPLRFEVTGGTGDLTGASGGGHYNLAFTLPTCPGPQQTVHVWFSGHLDRDGAGQ